MILQVGLGVKAGEQVAVEVVEAKASDEDLELLTGYGRPDLEGEAVLGAVKVLHPDVGCSWIELMDECCFLVKLRIILVGHSFE